MARRIVLFALSLSLPLSTPGLSAQPLPGDSASAGGGLQRVAFSVVGSTVGSATGFTVGRVSAGGLGALAGSVFGAALGANYVAGRSGTHGSLRPSLGVAVGGLIAGFIGTMAAAQIDENNGVVLLLGFSLGQGAFTGVAAAMR